MSDCLALDFGASSIRLIAARLANGVLSLRPLARQPNGPANQDGRQVWDYRRIFAWLETALAEAGKNGAYAGIGADSWGVDTVFLDAEGRLAGPAVSYRDRRTEGMIERFTAAVMSEDRLFAATGLPALSINTLFQLYAESLRAPDALRQAHRLLFTADYVHYWLSGVAVNERTLSSTSQMLTLDGDWWPEALAAVGLNPAALTKPVAPGCVLGELTPALRAATGLDCQVIAPASHDTQSAILAVPAAGEDWAYLSSGTWSIIGVESPRPFTGPDALAAGLGNEAGYGGRYCVQATVSGLWLVQEIRRLTGASSDGELAAAAAKADPFRTVIDPAHPRFIAPANMIDEIRAAAREAGEPEPDSTAALVRCAYDSLALLYRAKLEKIAQVTGRTVTTLHVVGGGSQADLFNRLCAAVTGRTVFAGPAEATAIGNALAQWIALGEIADIAEGRRLVAASFAPHRYDPVPLAGLDAAVARYDRISR